VSTDTYRLPDEFSGLRDIGILRDLDTHLVEAVARTHGVPRTAGPEGALLFALASHALDKGHVCLNLNKDDIFSEIAADEERADHRLPDACGRWLDKAVSPGVVPGKWSPVVGTPAENKPFVLDGNRLYVRRMYDYERSVAEKLLALARGTGDETHSVDNAIGELLQDADQRKAAKMALSRRLTIITGGPGTGKTYTVARILALLSQEAEASGRAMRVRLSAPTGKAAARMGESIRQAQSEVGDKFRPSVIVEPACTLERLLGFQSDSPYFRHDADNPLDADVVIMDEASMIDIAKMSKLLDALGPAARLVLLGDMHQLFSVQPGSVLAELCESKGLVECVARLATSRRFPPESPVGRLSKAVNEAQDARAAEAAWETLQRAEHTGRAETPSTRVQTFEVPAELATRRGVVNTAFARSILSGYRGFLSAQNPEEVFDALDEFRILCALRRGPFGVMRVNTLIEEILSLQKLGPDETLKELRPSRPLKRTGAFYDHRVIMITRNDYATGLFNGDVGVVLPDSERGGELAVFFPSDASAADSGKPKVRKVPCRLLPDHETSFAMSIHKSQGSEFKRILVLVPDADCPILTKELIYTAITRTQTGVELWCGRDAFVRAACRRVRRFTGLKDCIDQLGFTI